MRLYDEKGKFIGGVMDSEYEYIKDAIMPAAIEVHVPKAYVPASGYRVMVFGSLLSIICIILSLILSGHTAEGAGGFRGLLYSGGFFFYDKAFCIPIVAVVQLIAAMLLLREGVWFRVAFGFRLFCVLLFAIPMSNLTESFAPYPAIMEFFAVVATVVAFVRKTKMKPVGYRSLYNATGLCVSKVMFSAFALQYWYSTADAHILMAYILLFLYFCIELCIVYGYAQYNQKGQMR